MSAKLITVDGRITEVAPANGTDFQLEELSKFVGGYIEVLHPTSPKEGAVMVINEEGKLLGLPKNPVATQLWHDRALLGDYIVGDVLLCHADQLK